MSRRQESAAPDGAIIDDRDVVIAGHDLVVLDADRNEIARLGEQGELDLVGSATLNRFGLELFDRDDNSAVRISMASLGLEGPTDTVGGQLEGLPEIETPFRNRVTLRVGATDTVAAVEVNDAWNRRVVKLDGLGATVRVGAEGHDGGVVVVDDVGREVVNLLGGTASVTVGSDGNGGNVVIRAVDGTDTIDLNGGTATLIVGANSNEGSVAILDGDGRDAFRVDGGSATVTVGSPNRPGDLIVHDLLGNRAIWMTGADAVLRVGGTGQEGDLIVRDAVGRDVLHMDGEDAVLIVGADGNEGDIIVRDDTGADRIQLNGSTGDIKLLGADLAEDFDTATDITPGAVVIAIGPDEVAQSTVAGDRRVVGIASGAGDLQPALRLATRPGRKRTPVALVGRVYCQADAGPGPIEVGDLLTSSDIPGHAMRVGEHEAGAGTIIGKALAPLADGTGLVPVLLMLR